MEYAIDAELEYDIEILIVLEVMDVFDYPRMVQRWNQSNLFLDLLKQGTTFSMFSSLLFWFWLYFFITFIAYLVSSLGCLTS